MTYQGPPDRDALLLQAWYADEPWKLLTCCVLLNCTSRVQVDAILDELLGKFDEPHKMALAGPELEELITSLGLQNRRGAILRSLAQWWLDNEGRSAQVGDRMKMMEPPGVGEYARDSYMIFAEGPTEENVSFALENESWPADKELSRWFGELRAVGEDPEALRDGWQWKLDHPGGYISDGELQALMEHSAGDPE